MNVPTLHSFSENSATQHATHDGVKMPHSSFGETLRKALRDVNILQREAGTAIEKMVAGEDVDIHEVMIAVEKARTSFDLLMEVRNKTIEAYRELMRMQI